MSEKERLLRDTFTKYQDAMRDDPHLAETSIARAHSRRRKRWAGIAGGVVAVAIVGSVWLLQSPSTDRSSEPAQWTSHSVDDYWRVVDRIYGTLGHTYHPTTCERLEAIAPDGLALPPAPHGVLTQSLFGKPPPETASEIFNARWADAMRVAANANVGGAKRCFEQQQVVVKLISEATLILGQPPNWM